MLEKRKHGVEDLRGDFFDELLQSKGLNDFDIQKWALAHLSANHGGLKQPLINRMISLDASLKKAEAWTEK